MDKVEVGEVKTMVITKKEMAKSLPRVGEAVAFTTERNGELVYGNGIVKEVSEVDAEKNHYIFVVEADDGEFYPVHYVNRTRPRDTLLLKACNPRVDEKIKMIGMTSAKRHAMYKNMYHEQEAHKVLPKEGDLVSYKTTIKGEPVEGRGIVMKVRLRNAHKALALVNIQNHRAETVQVYMNNESFPDDVILVEKGD